MTLRHPAWRGTLLGLFCALSVWVIYIASPLLHGLEAWMLDAGFFYRGPRPTTARVVLVGIDDSSLAELRKPLPYLSPELAEVVRHLHAQKASAIGIDLVIPDELRDRPEIERRDGEGSGRALGAAIKEAGNVVLAQWWDGQSMQLPLAQWRFKALTDPDSERRDLGFINLTTDDDQFLRRQQLLLRVGDRSEPHFALALYARSRNAAYSWDNDRRTVKIGEETIPLDAEQQMRINYVGPPGSFPILSFREVLADARAKRPNSTLDGAIVLIGMTARGQQDYHSTPYANRYAHYVSGGPCGLMSGTEVHAHILATMQDRAFITTPNWLTSLPLLLVFGILLGHFMARLNLAWGLLLAVGHHFFWKLLALAAFSWFGWRIEVVSMLMLGALVYAATFAFRWRTLRKMMGLVKSEGIARALEADPRRLDPGGEERIITVLFADVRSFTDFSEKHTAPEVVALLNEYFEAIVPLIESEGGVIDKYMGDGIMVLFGAPANLPDHALRAVRAAVAMVRAVHAKRADWIRLGNPTMRIGVGVHTGKVVVGAIGGARRLDYTAIGDVVNAAARIESENKPQGTEVLVSSTTFAAVPPEITRQLGYVGDTREVIVKGKQESLTLYPLIVP